MQTFPQQAACWLCPKCGEITRFAFNGMEMLREIEQEIDILLSLKQSIVLSHIRSSCIPGGVSQQRTKLHRVCLAAATAGRARTTCQARTSLMSVHRTIH